MPQAVACWTHQSAGQLTYCVIRMQNVQLRIKPIPKQLTFIPSALTTLVSNMVSFTVCTLVTWSHDHEPSQLILIDAEVCRVMLGQLVCSHVCITLLLCDKCLLALFLPPR